MIFPFFSFLVLYSTVFCALSSPFIEEYAGCEIERPEVPVKAYEQMAFLTKETMTDLFDRLLTKERLAKINFVTDYQIREETITGKTEFSITFESDFLDRLYQFDVEFRKLLQDSQTSYIITTLGYSYTSPERAIDAFNLKIQTKIDMIFNKIKNVSNCINSSLTLRKL
jgi:hypothetical protein